MEKTYDILFNNESSQDINDIRENYFIEGQTRSITFLPNTNQINIIIGSNNSGKSRFMRYLMSCKNLIGIKDLENLVSFISDYNKNVKRFNRDNIDLQRERFENETSRSISSSGIIQGKEEYDLRGKHRLNEITSHFLSVENQIQNNLKSLRSLRKIGIQEPYFDNYPAIDVKDFTNLKSYYIPTLRSAHSLFKYSDGEFIKIEEDIYFDTLQKSYELKEEIEIFTGLHLYKEILNSRNADRFTRKSFEKFEQFISQNFFGGKPVDIVAEFNKDHNLSGKNDSEFISIHIEDEMIESRKLYELGDGIQAIIILMYKIFMAENNSFVFIDEPELNLHPGMQRLFLDQLSSNKDLLDKNLTYFISTHSNHFLDLTLEKDHISIYSFSFRSIENNINTFNIRNVNSGDNTVLKNLGVNNSSVFLANCSIWVEGISDRNYIKAFLKSYINSLGKTGKRLKEDIDYAFFEYAGSNIEHYIFDDIVSSEKKEIISNIHALSISNRIFLLADSDNVTKTSRKGIRLKELKDVESENFIPYVIWNIREIENLLTKEIWQEILIYLCNKNLLKDHRQKIQTNIIEIIKDVDMSSYQKEYIGEFLNAMNMKLGKIKKTSIINESNYKKLDNGKFGTLTNKRELSEIILAQNFSWDILKQNKDIESLTIKIYKFITQTLDK